MEIIANLGHDGEIIRYERWYEEAIKEALNMFNRLDSREREKVVNGEPDYFIMVVHNGNKASGLEIFSDYVKAKEMHGIERPNEAEKAHIEDSFLTLVFARMGL